MTILSRYSPVPYVEPVSSTREFRHYVLKLLGLSAYGSYRLQVTRSKEFVKIALRGKSTIVQPYLRLAFVIRRLP